MTQEKFYENKELKEISDPMKSNTWSVIILTGVIFLCSLGVYGWRLDRVPAMVWDEQLHIPAARAWLEGGSPKVLEDPPLGKIVLGLSIHLFGDRPLAHRLPSLISGALVAALLFWGAARATGRLLCGGLATGLWLSSALAYPLARLGTLDMMLTATMVASFVLFLEIPQTNSKGAKIALLYAAIAMAALSGGIKFLGYLLLPIFLIGLFQMRSQWALKSSLLHWTLGVMALPLAFLAAGYRLIGIPFNQIPGQWMGMYQFHMEDKMPHGRLSRWYEWFLFRGGHWFYQRPSPDGIVSAAAIQSPVLWFLGPLSTLLLLIRGIWKRDPIGLWIGLGVLFQVLFWMFFKQRTLLYYALPMEPFFCLGVGWGVNILLKCRSSS